MAVLVNQRTSGQAEWLAAALKDSERGRLFGTNTAGSGYTSTLIDLPHDLGGVPLVTARIQWMGFLDEWIEKETTTW